jgi:dolichyl-phosphate-mannose--protein O-mannosyl transferase
VSSAAAVETTAQAITAATLLLHDSSPRDLALLAVRDHLGYPGVYICVGWLVGWLVWLVWVFFGFFFC